MFSVYNCCLWKYVEVIACVENTNILECYEILNNIE